MIRRIVLLLLLSQACGDATPTRTLVRFSTSGALTPPEGALLHVVGYGDGVRQHEQGEELGMFNFAEGVTLPVEAEEDEGARRFTLFAELLSATGTRLSWARIRSGFVQDEKREIRIEFQAACPDPSDRELPTNYDASEACGSHDTCAAFDDAAFEGAAVCRSACFTPESIGAEDAAPSLPVACPIEDDIVVDVLEHGTSYACALSSTEPFCWGQLGASGTSGTGETNAPLFRQPSRTFTPEGRATFRPGLDDVVDMAVSSRVACMVLADGGLRCGGGDATLLVGEGDDIPCCQVTPAVFSNVAEVEVGTYICALSDNQLFCSGLVPPHVPDVDAPVSPARPYDRGTAPASWTSLFGGPSFLAGLGPEQLEVLTHPEAFDLSGMTVPSSDVAQVAINEHGICVGVNGGGVRCWGDHAPQDLGAEWLQIAMSSSERGAPEHRCAIREDSTLWCWGASDDGVLGVEPRGLVTFEERVQVGSDDDWTGVSLGEHVSCGIRSGGHLYCWGANERRELGRDGANTHIPARVPVPRW